VVHAQRIGRGNLVVADSEQFDLTVDFGRDLLALFELHVAAADDERLRSGHGARRDLHVGFLRVKIGADVDARVVVLLADGRLDLGIAAAAATDGRERGERCRKEGSRRKNGSNAHDGSLSGTKYGW
jgi:hypothetical protein